MLKQPEGPVHDRVPAIRAVAQKTGRAPVEMEDESAEGEEGFQVRQRSAEIEARTLCPFAGHLRHGVAHFHLGGRDRDRAIERSESLEFFDELRAVSVIDAGEREVNRYRIERPYVGASLIAAIQDALDAHRHSSQRDPPPASNRLN